MTKKEAIETIKDICLTTEQLTRIEKALECLLSQPSLPSNLDEAELKYVEFSDYPPANQEEELMVYNAFKAGAEWKAGQGETFNGFMSVKWKRSLIAIEGSSQNFKYGENVIVQIRKKQ